MDEANAAAAAYREIKSRIVNLDYRIGEKLSEARLVAELGLGRSPIRSALARLRTEGWVAVSPQSGTYVKALTIREIEEVTELRILLEMHAAAEAARRITDAEIASLQQAFRAIARQVAKGNAEAFITIDNKLHYAIYRAAANELVTEILLNLRDKVQWIRRACAVSSERVQEGFAELEEIMAAIAARSPREAASKMRRHISNAASFCKNVDQLPAIVQASARRDPAQQPEKPRSAARTSGG